ncbi:tetraacyldisaccharide 4'-kinase [Gluconobacter wancherniae]
MRLHPPRFWSRPGMSLLTAAFVPFSSITTRLGRRRRRRTPFRANVPVLCCGNVTVGGTGKTPLTLDLVKRLQERGMSPHILSRGHGGSEKGPILVDLRVHQPRDVGDEPLLLAAAAPTWIGADRSETALCAVGHGADCLVMDDGFQNPTLHQDVSILVVDGPSAFGNGRVLPAGPLREPLADALDRASALVVIGDDTHKLIAHLPQPSHRTQARLIPGPEIRNLQGRRVVAFAGIGRPEKFFDMLRDAGVNPVRTIFFPDHHQYGARDIRRLEALNREAGTTLVTTTKDAVKLPATFRSQIQVITVELRWMDSTFPDRLLDLLIPTP